MSETEKILTTVSSFYETDLFVKTHKREVSFPRMVAMYMFCVFTNWGLKEIGQVWGTDHSALPIQR